MNEPLDAKKSRSLEGGPSFSLRNRAERVVWRVTWLLLARLVPPPFSWAWRRLLLRLFGARIAGRVRVYPSARIWLPRHLAMESGSTIGPCVECYNIARVEIGRGALVSQRAFLCTGDHDHRDPAFQLIASPIVLGSESWIAAEAFVGPGVKVGQGAVLAARGAAAETLPNWTVWAGNPARKVADRVRRSEEASQRLR